MSDPADLNLARRAPSPRVRRIAIDVALPFLGAASLLAPMLAALASVPPTVVRATPDLVPVIHVEPFEDLAAGSCTADAPLHVGPSSVHGKLMGEGALRARMTAAVSGCDGDWFGDVMVSVKVDENGSIRDVRAHAGGDGRMSTCVIRNIMRDGPVQARGPAALTIGYFMGGRSL